MATSNGEYLLQLPSGAIWRPLREYAILTRIGQELAIAIAGLDLQRTLSETKTLHFLLLAAIRSEESFC